MITKELFIKTMNRMMKANDKLEDLEQSARSVFNCSLELEGAYEYLYSEIEVLEQDLNDETELLEYLVYELNFLREWEPGKVTIDGKQLDFSTWEKVYDWLAAGNEKVKECK